MKLICTRSICSDFEEGSVYTVVDMNNEYSTTSYTVLDEDADERIVPLQGFVWDFEIVED